LSIFEPKNSNHQQKTKVKNTEPPSEATSVANFGVTVPAGSEKNPAVSG
jgi:hypothetical protein